MQFCLKKPRNFHAAKLYAIKQCPVEYLEAYLQKAKLDVSNDKESALICRIFKTKSGHKISETRGISYSRIEEFKSAYRKLRRHPRIFGLHNLRSGGASAAANNGISDRVISKQGCQSSEKPRDGYIKDSVVKRLTV